MAANAAPSKATPHGVPHLHSDTQKSLVSLVSRWAPGRVLVASVICMRKLGYVGHQTSRCRLLSAGLCRYRSTDCSSFVSAFIIKCQLSLPFWVVTFWVVPFESSCPTLDLSFLEIVCICLFSGWCALPSVTCRPLPGWCLPASGTRGELFV